MKDRVLVVDDSAINRRILAGALSKAGYDILEATDGIEAVEVARAGRPDLVLLDIAMPNRDGFEVCEILRADAATARTPIIFITAKSEPQDVARAFAIGASDYVTKPFHLSEVKARVSVHMRLLRAEEDLKRSHAQLLRAQKLESIGQLAAGVAHEINTPTQYVSDNARFLRDAFGDVVRLLGELRRLVDPSAGRDPAEALASISTALDAADVDYLVEEVPRALSQSIQGLQRIAEIVRAMKEFSHPGTKEKTPTDLHRGIANTIAVARNEWKYVAEVVTDFDPELPPVPCSAGDVNQVVLNLIVNAAHAIAERLGPDASAKGRITVATRRDGDWAEVRVSDTGCGIPAELRERVFDPFFTTKEPGKGTGQGLAIAHAVVVDLHAGTLALESEVGVGTTFVLRLPLRLREAAA